MFNKSSLKKIAFIAGFSILSYFTPVVFCESTNKNEPKIEVTYKNWVKDAIEVSIKTDAKNQINSYFFSEIDITYRKENGTSQVTPLLVISTSQVTPSLTISTYEEKIENNRIEVNEVELIDYNLDGRVDGAEFGSYASTDREFLRKDAKKEDQMKWLEFDRQFAKYMEQFGYLLLNDPEVKAGKFPELKGHLSKLQKEIEKYDEDLSVILKIQE